MEGVEDLVRGFRNARAAEQAGFGMVVSFSTTVAVSRVLNYVRERRRAMPRVRSLGRAAAMIPRTNNLRIHHFVPGTAIAFAAGAAAILVHPTRAGLWLSVPFGAGAAMTADELPIMVGRNNPYWGAERYALGLTIASAIAASGLVAVFVRSGRLIRHGEESDVALSHSLETGAKRLRTTGDTHDAQQESAAGFSDHEIMIRLHDTRSEEVLLWLHSRDDSVAGLAGHLDEDEQREIRLQLESLRLLSTNTSLDRQWELTELGARIAGKIAVTVHDESSHRLRRLRVAARRGSEKTK